LSKATKSGAYSPLSFQVNRTVTFSAAMAVCGSAIEAVNARNPLAAIITRSLRAVFVMMSPPDVAMYLRLHRTYLGSIGVPEAPIVP
jgi:hypothetical protein